MLPLHTTIRILVSFTFALIVITSCSDRSKTDLEVIKALNESLLNSNKAITVSISDIMNALQDKLNDQGTSERAKVWYPRAQMIQRVSKDVINRVERIKNDFKKTERKKMLEDDSLGLYSLLVEYKNNLLPIDPRLTDDLKNSLKIFTKEIDSSKENQMDLLKNYFIGASIPAAEAMLTKIQNNIRINEERMVMYCFEQCGRVGGPCTFISALVGQSSSIVQANEKIEIIAGIGSFNPDCKPEVFIYHKPVPIMADGIAIYKLKAASRPGKYYVPVKINYTDQNGKAVTVEKEIEYTVANIQKQ